MLFGHKRNPHGYEIKWRDNDGFSTLRDIKVKLFPDRLEIEKLEIIIPFSSLNNCDRRVLIRRIINEISATTGIPEDEFVIRHK